MIFEELELYNFGIYKDKNLIRLDSPTPELPVILIGALNGAGKTTFLDALQLVLYGKHAKCSNRGKQSYSSFLEKCINHYADTPEASLSLRFRHETGNMEPQHYQIIRFWSKTGREVKETVTVSCNNEVDDLLSENWEDFINEIIPQSISELFFFDGEKIEDLANPRRSSEILKTGVEALLGLDMLAKLENDLKVIERRKKENQLSEDKTFLVESLKSEYEQLCAEKKTTAEKLDHLYTEKDNINEVYLGIKNELLTRGADKLALKDSYNSQKNELESKIYTIKHEIIKITAGALPLNIVKELCSSVFNKVNEEKKFKAFKAAEPFIEKLVTEVQAAFNAISIPHNIKIELSNKIEKIISSEKSLYNKGYFLTELNIDEDAFNKEIKEAILYAESLLENKKETLESLLLLEKKLATIPNFKDVQHIIEKAAKQEEKLDNIQKKIRVASDELLSLDNKINENQRKYNSEILKYNADTFEQKRQAQIIKHIESLSVIINSFYNQLVKENITKLESRIKSKFDQLKRKDSLIEKISINPEDFTISLLASDNKPISTERLSAGERQLFSIAILWGLADCSGKELPTIIDTPMGRLDGVHREHLIKNYFPNSSSQLILLSTDEEIYGDYYKKLKPYIAKEYTIEFDELRKTSFFKEGYLEEVS
ncbi:DNA sulfur modification protein DndD [Enterobacter hormaechei subsp. xiangfangensis]|uniref:DNA sulfur modification protein DndD n=1 Tax=Enterobacter hormaechei TaxID=158836 RepID=UPI001BE09B07|nr:DNA sulfur modification protein DndD [Enterobacter hormaechei]MBT2011243.1 DNA sulfur modification protein DndD [Enterobacter hormaechei subsp. xiangfangensis]MBT2019986.1 DNA sulfur modification protein DndD [Enterobacter hormaechei subsp. xiangfangensis]MBT2042751.1 DNA sulfur modification protein DndD [Enterobacter hormaechei subsp. xiangfangensis]MED5748467.1 DNA sulfur modification protein DndD [Enterobacter hormaechei]